MYLIACQDLSTVSFVLARAIQNERSSGTGLRFSVTHYTWDYQIRLIHDCTKRYSKSIAELSAFMDSAGGLGVDVAVQQVSKALTILKKQSKQRTWEIRKVY